MNTKLDEFGQELARELHRSALSRPIDLLDAQSHLQVRLDRGRRNLAVAGIAAIIVLIASTAILLGAQQRQQSQVVNPRPSTEVTVIVVSRASEPRGPADFEWPLLQAVRGSTVATFAGWEAAAGYADGRRALDAAADRAAVVLLSGPDLQDYVPEAAADHPQTDFVVVDGVAAVPGARVVNFAAEQAAFLAGALAASVARAGPDRCRLRCPTGDHGGNRCRLHRWRARGEPGPGGRRAVPDRAPEPLGIRRCGRPGARSHGYLRNRCRRGAGGRTHHSGRAAVGRWAAALGDRVRP